MLRLTENQIDRTIANRRIFLLAGLALMVLPFLLPRGFGFGLLSGFALLGLGIYCLVFQKWRTDPGLWMLAVFLFVTLSPLYVYFSYLRFRSVFQPAVPNPATWSQVLFSLDVGMALAIFLKQVRLAFSVACENWRRTKGHTEQ